MNVIIVDSSKKLRNCWCSCTHRTLDHKIMNMNEVDTVIEVISVPLQ